MSSAFTRGEEPDLRDFVARLRDSYDRSANSAEAEMVSQVFFFNVMGQDDLVSRCRLRQPEEDPDVAACSIQARCN